MENKVLVKPLNTTEEIGLRLTNFLVSSPYHLGILLSSIALFLLYILVADLSYYFIVGPASHAIFWLPSGISFALFIWARHHNGLLFSWTLAIFLGQWLIVTLNQVPPITTFCWAVSNCLLPNMAVFLSRIFKLDRFDFGKIRDVVLFILIIPLAVLPGSIIAAVGSRWGFEVKDFWTVVFTWATSDLLGVLLVAPAILSWNRPKSMAPGKVNEAILLLVMLLLSSGYMILFQRSHLLDWSFFSFLTFFVAWASIRFGPRGTAGVLLIIELLLIIAMVRGAGEVDVIKIISKEQIWSVQVIISNVGILMLLLAAGIEEQRNARMQAEEALKVRDEFISIASHELNSPLSALSLQMQFLNQLLTSGDIKTYPMDKLRDLGRVSDTQIQKFSTLIRNLLDVSRIRAGKLHLEMEEVDLVQLCKGVVKHFELDMQQAHCSLEFKSDEKILGHWDRMRIEQVLSNLVSNAIKYGSGKPIEVFIRSFGEKVQIIVRDHGIGIPQEDHERIFNRFERLMSSKTIHGLGLGLFIVKQILDEHHGSIRVESVPGQGCTFIVELPLWPTGQNSAVKLA